jgi:hypothetical protein
VEVGPGVAFAAGGAAGDGGVAIGLDVASALALEAAGDAGAGFWLAGVPAHAARRTPRRRDAARRFAFI